MRLVSFKVEEWTDEQRQKQMSSTITLTVGPYLSWSATESVELQPGQYMLDEFEAGALRLTMAEAEPQS